MTPLARWVLLALLLAVVEAHPYEHACVCLCCVQNGSPNIAEVCDDLRIQDLQSGASLHVVRDIFELCPIADHKTPHSQFVPDAVVRRDIWDRLVKRHGCSCDNYRKLEESEEQGFENAVPNMLNESGDNGAWAPAELDRREWSKDLPDDRTKISVAEKVNAMGETANLNADSSKNETDSTEEPIDWEVWCITQCENGQGGSACNCDIIP